MAEQKIFITFASFKNQACPLLQCVQNSKKYLSNTEVAKLVKSSNEYFSNPQNRQFGRLITEQLPEDYNEVNFSPYFNIKSNQSKPQIKTTSRK